MMRVSAIFVGFFAGLMVLAAPEMSHAAPASAAAPGHGVRAEDFSAQSRKTIRRAPRRIPIWRGSSYPGPNAVRVCNAHYEQEYRPSGTVIVPRMTCYWRG
jgi:zinc transporter ZupT